MIFGRRLFINPSPFPPFGDLLSIDIETTEAKNGHAFVGMSVYDGSGCVYYFTSLSSDLKNLLEGKWLLAHNLKFDAKELKKWGINIQSNQFAYDTMLASYSIDSGAETHALKPLAKKNLGYVWSTYKEMTETTTNTEHVRTHKMLVGADGKRRKTLLAQPEIEVKVKKIKQTLDKLPVEKVAEYCASDSVATWDLMVHQKRTMSNDARYVFNSIEMPVIKVLFDMENRGIRIDQEKLQSLHNEFQADSNRLQADIFKEMHLTDPINLNSSQQLAPHLEKAGMKLPLTEKGNKKTSKDVLQQYKGIRLADLLLEYSEVKKLLTAFTGPMLLLGDRIRPTFNQVVHESETQEEGIETGRLSCSNPNLQQIPKRSKRGKKVREVFVPEEGEMLVCSDLSQIEPRILTHITREPYLIDVYRNNKDVYTSIVAGTSVGDREDARDYGKTGYLALSYLAQPRKLSKAWRVDIEEAQEIFDGMWKNLPAVKAWQQQTMRIAKQMKGVKTLFKRFRSLPGIYSYDWGERSRAERKAVNTSIQGAAADLFKLIMVKLAEAGYQLRLVVHDEVLISVPKEDAKEHMKAVVDIMENVVKLIVPLKADAGVGMSWGAAKP